MSPAMLMAVLSLSSILIWTWSFAISTLSSLAGLLATIEPDIPPSKIKILSPHSHIIPHLWHVFRSSCYIVGFRNMPCQKQLLYRIYVHLFVLWHSLYLSINLYHMRHAIHSRTSFFCHSNQLLKFLFVCIITFSIYFKLNTFCYWFVSYTEE